MRDALMYNQSIFDLVFSPILPMDGSMVVDDRFLQGEEEDGTENGEGDSE